MTREKISNQPKTTLYKVYKVLKEVARCDRQAILVILSNPKKLLDDNIIMLVGNNEKAESIFNVLLKV